MLYYDQFVIVINEVHAF